MYQVWGQPPTSSSGGPSPPDTVCSRTPATSVSRLSNVLVKPAGSQGTPCTVPNPRTGSPGCFIRSVPFVAGASLLGQVGQQPGPARGPAETVASELARGGIVQAGEGGQKAE